MWKNSSFDIMMHCDAERSNEVSMLTSYPRLVSVQSSCATTVNIDISHGAWGPGLGK